VLVLVAAGFLAFVGIDRLTGGKLTAALYGQGDDASG
jgi:hypothetical protein